LLPDGMSASDFKAEKFSDILYKVDFIVDNGETVDPFSGYATIDGSLFLLGMMGSNDLPGTFNVFDLDTPIPAQPPAGGDTGDTGGVPLPEPELQCSTMEKTETPLLQAFVVSYCPFGLQTQRALLPVARLLPDNVEIRYIGDVVDGKVTAMHGEEEAAENLKQICIREEQPEVFLDYLECFIIAGESNACSATAKVDTAMLNECIADPSKGTAYAAVDFALYYQYKTDIAARYGVSESLLSFGSPTIVYNGDAPLSYNADGGYYSPSTEFVFAGLNPTAGAGRSSNVFKELVCCGMTKEAGACSTQLSIENAATGFTPADTGTGTGSC